MSWCGTCGHKSEVHHNFGRGACSYRIPYEGWALEYDWRCDCEAFVSFAALFTRRVAVILLFVFVLGSLPAVVDLIAGAPR